MNPPDASSSSATQPEPSEEEFRAELEELKAKLDAMERGSRESVEVTREMMDFTRRHFARMERKGLDPAAYLAKAERSLQVVAKADAEVEAIEEKLLHAHAELADNMPALTEATFEIFERLRAKWDELDFAQRETWGPILEEFEENREGWLAELPIEVRRRLEEKYPRQAGE